MATQDFHTTITVSVSSKEASAKINQVDKWWAKKVIGKSENLNDEFTVDFGSTWVDFRISELKSGEKIVWTVTDCNLEWIKNKKEWNGTSVVFEISHGNDTTQIDFIHKGLTPSCECFEDCKIGWTGHVTESLVQFINEGVGVPL